MSKKPSKQAPAPPVDLEAFMRQFTRDPIDVAIERVTEWPAKCPGPCFPIVYRAWMQHPAFLPA